MEKFQIRIPFDRHGHLRDISRLLPYVLIHSLKSFGGMVVMPNLSNPITNYEMLRSYKWGINDVCSKYPRWSKNFLFIMTGYLTDNTSPDNVEQGFKEGAWKAMKLYPFGATTNSDRGVTNLNKIFPVLERMEKIGMPLLIHAETVISKNEKNNSKIYDNVPFKNRERVFVDESLIPICKHFPGLIISIEHISTKEGAQFVESCSNNVVGTVTPHHIKDTEDAILHGGFPPYKPGGYVENICLPSLKTQDDVFYIRHAIMKGEKRYKFGAGTDTAPHIEEDKYKPGSCCGIFNSPFAVEFYAMVFEEEGMLESKNIIIFENFMSENNLWIYGIENFSKEMITLEKKEQWIPKSFSPGIRPFKAEQTIPWTMTREIQKN